MTRHESPWQGRQVQAFMILSAKVLTLGTRWTLSLRNEDRGPSVVWQKECEVLCQVHVARSIDNAESVTQINALVVILNSEQF